MTGTHGLRLLLRGLWWRRGLTSAIFAVAVVTTTAAALGPLYARAAGESILQDHLVQAGSDAGLRMNTNLIIEDPAALRGLEGHLLKTGAIKGYTSRVDSLYTGQGVSAFVPHAPLGQVQTHLLWREGSCQHLVIVSGRCPSAANEVLASQRTIDERIYHWKLGTKLELGELPNAEDPYYGQPTVLPPVRIVGTYRPRDAVGPFWFGQNYFDQHPNIDKADTVDTLFVGKQEFLSLKLYSYVEADFDYQLTPSAVRLNDLPAERAAITRLLAQHRDSGGIQVQTKILTVLDEAAQERHQVNIAMLLITLQLGLLAWLVLFQVVSDAIEARGNEIAMAKLRGFSPWATARFGLGEPLALLAVAVPIGLLVAIAVTHAFAASILVKGVPVLLTSAPVVAALVAFAGGGVAAAVAAHRTLTRSVLEQWRRTERRPGHGKLALVIDLAVAAAAITGLVLIGTSNGTASKHGTITLLAPGLLVLAVAVIGVRLVPLACRWIARATRGSRRMGIFLASRQVSRRPLGLRLCAFLAVAVGLATFAVAGESIASTNRTARAAAEVGADRVAGVQFNSGLDPVNAVRRADPHGRWAMAAATWLPDGGNSVVGTLLAVDSSRLAAVGSPVSGAPTGKQLAAITGAGGQPPLAITASTMRVHLTAAGLQGNVPPVVQLNFRTPTVPFAKAQGTAIRAGSHTYDIAVPCRSGCQLRGLTWDRPIEAATVLRGSLTLTGLDVRVGTAWRPLDIRLGRHRAWLPEAPQGQASDAVSVTGAGVVDRFTNQNGGYAGITYAVDPQPMPAVATHAAMATDPSAPRVPALLDGIGITARFTVQRYTPVLPLVGDNGVMLDVRFVQDELPGFVSEAAWQVWLGPNAPPDALPRLTAAGLQIISVKTEQARIDQLARQGPALALLLLLACAVGGAVLAFGATATSISAGSRRRSYELAALRVVGVKRPALVRAGVIEQLLLLGSALLLGLPTGLIAARLAMPLIPEFADATPITLHYTPQAMPTTVFGAALTVLLVVTAVVGAWASLRVAVPSRLREAE